MTLCFQLSELAASNGVGIHKPVTINHLRKPLPAISEPRKANGKSESYYTTAGSSNHDALQGTV